MDPEARVVVTARDTTGAAFASADRHLKSFARGVTQLRSGLSLLGVAFSGRALAQWMSRAIQATDAVGEQKEAVDAAKKAFQEFQAASDRLAESIAVHLTPSISLLAQALDGIRVIWSPTQDEKLSQQIRQIEDEINRLARGIIKFEEGNFWQRLAGEEVWENAREKVEELRVELQKLYAERDRRAAEATKPQDGLEEFDIAAIRARRAEVIRSMPKFDLNAPSEEQLRAAQRLTEQMKTDVEKQVEAWNEAEALFSRGLITPETLNRFRDSLLEPIEVTADRMKEAVGEMTEEATAFAATMGEAFRDSFADWIIGADLSFKDLLKRMAADIVTSGIFDAFAAMFSGGTSGVAKFFGSFFGGARANGGPVSSGRAYLVGERGPEMFVPSGSGMIAAGAGGMNVNISNHIDARGADPSLIQRLPAILDAHRQQTKAEIRDLMRRNRF